MSIQIDNKILEMCDHTYVVCSLMGLGFHLLTYALAVSSLPFIV